MLGPLIDLWLCCGLGIFEQCSEYLSDPSLNCLLHLTVRDPQVLFWPDKLSVRFHFVKELAIEFPTKPIWPQAILVCQQW